MASKPLVWLHGEVKTPPFTLEGRIGVCVLLRRLQEGEMLTMPSIGAHCHELRVRDAQANWRIIYRIDDDAIVIAEVFAKTTRTTPPEVITNSQRRLRAYDAA